MERKQCFLCKEKNAGTNKHIRSQKDILCRKKLSSCSTYEEAEINQLDCEHQILYPGHVLFLPRRTVHSAPLLVLSQLTWHLGSPRKMGCRCAMRIMLHVSFKMNGSFKCDSSCDGQCGNTGCDENCDACDGCSPDTCGSQCDTGCDGYFCDHSCDHSCRKNGDFAHQIMTLQ